MQITKEILIEKVNSKNKNWFYKLYNGECDGETAKEFKVVYDQNYGDGNEWYIAFSFPNLNMFILLEGYYSSWDSPHWDKVRFAQPYEYKETRYKGVTLEYIRDQKINEVLDEQDEEK